MASDRSVTDQPWTIPVRIGEIGRGLTRRLEADAPTRARIARALDLQALDRLEAEVSVAPALQGYEVKGYEAKGVLRAQLTQTCGVTLEPLPAEVDSDFAVRFVEASEVEPIETAHEVVVTFEDDDPPDVIEDGVVDLGAYVVEHLALALDPFPRKPGAVFEAPAQAAEPSPFAALAKLKPETRD
jgi:uncharacterized metal-binding protein YceD (DUF177 family)